MNLTQSSSVCVMWAEELLSTCGAGAAFQSHEHAGSQRTCCCLEQTRRLLQGSALSATPERSQQTSMTVCLPRPRGWKFPVLPSWESAQVQMELLLLILLWCRYLSAPQVVCAFIVINVKVHLHADLLVEASEAQTWWRFHLRAVSVCGAQNFNHFASCYSLEKRRQSRGS